MIISLWICIAALTSSTEGATQKGIPGNGPSSTSTSNNTGPQIRTLLELKPQRISTSTIPDICKLPKDKGDGRALFRRWYYDAAVKKCIKFTWGGSGGNDNRFKKEEDCKEKCGLGILTERPTDTFKPDIKLDFLTNEACTGKTTYTFNKEQPECRGWRRTTFDSCKIKCVKNEILSGCKQQRGNCQYIMWKGVSSLGNNRKGWCLHADDSCKRITIKNPGRKMWHLKKIDDEGFLEERKKVCYLTSTDCKNGWHKVSFQDCLTKCTKDEYPCSSGKKKCNFAMWREGRNDRSKGSCYFSDQCNKKKFNRKRPWILAQRQSDIIDIIDICKRPKYIGRGKAVLYRYYYDAATYTCKKFRFGGGRGNGNNFMDEATCLATCGIPPDAVPGTRSPTDDPSETSVPPPDEEGPPEDDEPPPEDEGEGDGELPPDDNGPPDDEEDETSEPPSWDEELPPDDDEPRLGDEDDEPPPDDEEPPSDTTGPPPDDEEPPPDTTDTGFGPPPPAAAPPSPPLSPADTGFGPPPAAAAPPPPPLSPASTGSRNGDICKLPPPRRGRGRAAFLRYYYDAATNTCKKFRFGGGKESGNIFKDEATCLEICGIAPEEISGTRRRSPTDDTTASSEVITNKASTKASIHQQKNDTMNTIKDNAKPLDVHGNKRKI